MVGLRYAAIIAQGAPKAIPGGRIGFSFYCGIYRSWSISQGPQPSPYRKCRTMLSRIWPFLPFLCFSERTHAYYRRYCHSQSSKSRGSS